MALNTLEFEFAPNAAEAFPVASMHYGVVGSGDMEVLMEAASQGGKATVTVVTPVSGFDHVWQLVLQKFFDEHPFGDVHVSINDNNATPVVVSLRLRQALAEIK